MSIANEVFVNEAVYPLSLVENSGKHEIRDANNEVVFRDGIPLSNGEIDYIFKVMEFYEAVKLLDGTR